MPLRIPKLSRILTSTHGGLNQVVTFRAFSVDYSIEQTDAAGDQMLSPYGVVASTEILPPKKSLPETPQRLSGKNTHRQQSVTENTARKTGLIDNPVVRFLPIFPKTRIYRINLLYSIDLLSGFSPLQESSHLQQALH
jgi:hypothetical protein